MNVLFISQCSKRALTETRRILDQFAERRGDRTWQTAITQDGLDTLRKLLRKTARKNTAVACHWIRGKDHSELMWIVGDVAQFNAQGAVPTNTTQRDVLRARDENNWHTADIIQLFAQLAALLHDLGKASVAFQERLRGKRTEKNIVRHEWVSLRLFAAFVGQDDDATWLQRLMQMTDADELLWRAEARLLRDGFDQAHPSPFAHLPPLAAAIGWLVVTHHRLPVLPVWNENNSGVKQQAFLGVRCKEFSADQLPNLLRTVTYDWNEQRQEVTPTQVEPYWAFAHPLPVILPKWRQRAKTLAERLLKHVQASTSTNTLNAPGNNAGVWLDNPYVMHIARMSLMLADHHYSALPPNSNERVKSDTKGPIFANTHRKDGSLKQTLDEHLLGVAKLAGTIVHHLPGFEKELPHLARHKGLKKRSSSERFRWQDKAANAAEAIRETTRDKGAFIINMASTGCGKTLANARILYALADPQQGMRATYALGLRTLTLQTGRSYRDDLGLGDDELAIRVGGSASRKMFEYYESLAENSGSASTQNLLEEDGHVIYEGQHADHPLLNKVLVDPHIRSLLSAPILVCTVDHLTPATEAQRAGRQIAPMLRLMSSDLILDELDDFDLADLPALTRLVHWAGLLGSRVILSSATLPPALLEGMFLAYRAGRVHFYRNRGELVSLNEDVLDVPCLWVDEFNVQHHAVIHAEGFQKTHAEFIVQRVKALENDIKKHGPKRRGQLLPLQLEKNVSKEKIHQAFADEIQKAIVDAHNAHHEKCPISQKRVSFGLVRMANIGPLFDVARALLQKGAPHGYCFHICVYHARFPLILRSAIENQLDTTLNRRKPEAVYERPDIRAQLDKSAAPNHVLIVLGSPVTEVGRDHDYDWAIVEPSSMRSLIQLAGRVQRHRQKICAENTPNIFIFDTNLRHFTAEKKSANEQPPAFIRPGFETTGVLDSPFRLCSHHLNRLLDERDYSIISAIPRIQPKLQLNSKRNFVDLEHARLMDCMLPKEIKPAARGQKASGLELNAASCWRHPQAGLTWILPQQQPFRENTIKEEELVFLPDDDNEEQLCIHKIFEKAKGDKPAVYTTAEGLVERLDLAKELGPNVSLWGEHSMATLLQDVAEDQGLSLRECAEKFTAVSVLQNTKGWLYHPALGFGKKE